MTSLEDRFTKDNSIIETVTTATSFRNALELLGEDSEDPQRMDQRGKILEAARDGGKFGEYGHLVDADVVTLLGRNLFRVYKEASIMLPQLRPGTNKETINNMPFGQLIDEIAQYEIEQGAAADSIGAANQVKNFEDCLDRYNTVMTNPEVRDVLKKISGGASRESLDVQEASVCDDFRRARNLLMVALNKVPATILKKFQGTSQYLWGDLKDKNYQQVLLQTTIYSEEAESKRIVIGGQTHANWRIGPNPRSWAKLP